VHIDKTPKATEQKTRACHQKRPKATKAKIWQNKATHKNHLTPAHLRTQSSPKPKENDDETLTLKGQR